MAKVVSHGNAVSKHDGKTDRRRDILGLKELPQPERKALFRDAQTHAPVLSEAEKQLLFRDGYVVIKNVVSRQAVENALLVCDQLSTQNPGQPGIGTQDAALVGLYNDSVFTEIIEEAIGPHTLPVVGFLAVGIGPLPPDAPMPQCHVDGSYAGLLHLKHSEIINSGQDLHTWGTRDDPRMLGPSGGAPLWQDQHSRLSIGSFTAFCGVCLNDQMQPGKGQFSVHRGAHNAVESFFRMQRDLGGPLGPGGPMWPRLRAGQNDTVTAGAMADAMVESYPSQPFDHPDWPWPEVTPVLMDAGDGVIALHSCPHMASPNLSDDPRMNIYYRIRRARGQNPHEGNRKVGWGASDHPDRAMNGEFLDDSEYGDDWDPFAHSIDCLCDHWQEWDGMQHIVQAAKASARL
jgi:hypothetical protein